MTNRAMLSITTVCVVALTAMMLVAFGYYCITVHRMRSDSQQLKAVSEVQRMISEGRSPSEIDAYAEPRIPNWQRMKRAGR